ncbi:MAG: lysophospholipid acyltransferase family protein [Pseudomonadota bacterium]
MAGLRTHARVCCWLTKTVVGIDFEVRGQENLSAGPALVASKHHSTWETFALIPMFADPVTIQKAELFHIPFHGWFSRKFGMIGIKRETGPSALRHMVRHAKRRIEDKRQILIFPEGTRKKVDAPADYKSGISLLYHELGVPCVPIALNSGLYWPRHSQMRHSGTIIVAFLEPILPGLSRKEFMKVLQHRVETATKQLVDEGRAKQKSDL